MARKVINTTHCRTSFRAFEKGRGKIENKWIFQFLRVTDRSVIYFFCFYFFNFKKNLFVI